MKCSTIFGISLTLLFISLGVAFYWYEYRPSRIRANCETQSTERATSFFKEIIGKKAPEGVFIQANKEVYYISCLREQGVEH